ncbi:YALI0F08987p [Yarrowia lipolytica CLIB122]|uniref:YALI0F08987p n=2 Tax=Yarrowia lipolytica TaxID=4952 RepID=Q6C2C6_YARLI|nr:YALI0F08987p [Yarrowia lipolytica CLIB122]AOW06883.1 hypothetical protein YALI1_F12562g [Yarrowia lipolytica]KAB8284058.1 hypothetical protein BKA91DRAFT_157295 [Yarrowia lipolytica]KAE8173645.1 hypothetical protein BKA90DRAFT_109453 [Yarrowia lipolytica]KAJ8055930.1 hypothetical protein LXG23DRAFT_18750 [Yarrowia lipolytica]RMI97789.1 hypothetical protein BD777DRAFT_147290 [Yarrowia lipolytica]|eukprot:XP_505186.1 YALI0F08987p [Yarrowia lipolytica CLIB122]
MSVHKTTPKAFQTDALRRVADWTKGIAGADPEPIKVGLSTQDFTFGSSSYKAGPLTSVGQGGNLVCICDTQRDTLQIWNCTDGNTYLLSTCKTVETEGGTVVGLHALDSTEVVVQVRLKKTIQINVYDTKTLSLVHTMEGPVKTPDSYTVNQAVRYLVLTAPTGEFFVYKRPNFELTEITGTAKVQTTQIQPAAAQKQRESSILPPFPHSAPLLDLQGRWLAYCRDAPDLDGVLTPVGLPPPGPLLERVLESLSMTAATSLKSLVAAGSRYYWGYESSQPNTATSKAGLSMRSWNLLGRKPPIVTVIDLQTGKEMCSFSPPSGLSFLSLSPYDLSIATASHNGEHVFTYDLTFADKEVNLISKHQRGKTPARVGGIIWTTSGGLGIVNAKQGSLHWFQRNMEYPFYSEEAKLWKLSGVRQGVSSCSDESSVLLLRGNRLVSVNQASGSVNHEWVFPLESAEPTRETKQVPTPVSFSTPVSTSNASSVFPSCASSVHNSATPPSSRGFHSPSGISGQNSVLNALRETQEAANARISAERKALLTAVDPLSVYELETCSPYPYFHSNKRTMQSTYAVGSNGHEKVPSESPQFNVFGGPIDYCPLDFGCGTGEVEMFGELDIEEYDYKGQVFSDAPGLDSDSHQSDRDSELATPESADSGLLLNVSQVEQALVGKQIVA